MKASQVMTFGPMSVRPEAPVKDVARLMLAREIDALPVVDAAGKVVGIISEKVMLEVMAGPRVDMLTDGSPSAGRDGPMTAADIMAHDVPWASPDTDVMSIARTMVETGRRHVVVLSGVRLVGIVSRWDLMKAIARPDDVIDREVNALLEEELQWTPPVLHVDGGEVVVEGWCDNGARQAVLKAARTVPGVIGVTFAS
jgi:CBS domain-containing protein